MTLPRTEVYLKCTSVGVKILLDTSLNNPYGTGVFLECGKCIRSANTSWHFLVGCLECCKPILVGSVLKGQECICCENTPWHFLVIECQKSSEILDEWINNTEQECIKSGEVYKKCQHFKALSFSEVSKSVEISKMPLTKCKISIKMCKRDFHIQECGPVVIKWQKSGHSWSTWEVVTKHYLYSIVYMSMACLCNNSIHQPGIIR